MKLRIIDAHNHPNWYGHNVRRLIQNMDEHGIARTWLLSWEIPLREYEVQPAYWGLMDPRGVAAPLGQVVEALERFPDRLVGGWAPDPRNRHARQRLRAARELHGIRVCGEVKCRMRYDDPDALALFRFCGDLRMPVCFHLECPEFVRERQWAHPAAWEPWYGGPIDVVETMCRTCPQTVFLGHGPGFWREISGDASASTETYPHGPVTPEGRLPALLRLHSNLYGDLSAGSGCNALERDLKHAREFVLEFQDRLLFGRDSMEGRLLATLRQLRLARSVLNKILWENAERLLTQADGSALNPFEVSC